MNYKKKYLTHPEQVKQLKSHGLTIGDEEEAKRFLSEFGYYRLSAYFEPLQSRETGRFFENRDFNDVVALYMFDRKLRQHVDEALEIVEVDLKAKVVYVLARRDPFVHENLKHFVDKDEHADWLERVHDETEKSKEKFIDHYKAKYFDDFPKLPLWMLTEIISFGSIVKFLDNLDRDLKREVYNDMGFEPNKYKLPYSWFHSLSQARNVCAHRGRLWNREMGVVPHRDPREEAWRGVDIRRVGAILYVLNNLLKRQTSTLKFRKEWRKNIIRILEETPYPEFILRGMGFNPNHALWRE